MKKQLCLILLLLFLGNIALYAQCSVNAGGNATICGTSYTLQGSSSGSTNGTPTWTIVSKPSGAPDPVISNVNSLTPNVTGMTYPGNYVFQMAQNCSSSETATSQVTITAPGDVSTFSAGADITNIPATIGVATFNATIPSGYTASWTYYNLNSYEFNNAVVTTNATMTGTTTATPTLTLTKKVDHDIDPVYRAVLRITSINNPSCWYEDDAIVRFIPNPNVSFPIIKDFCGSPSSTAKNRYYYEPNASSAKFSDDTANASANSAFGTTIMMNVISQPAGGNLAYDRIRNGRLYFASDFNQTPGAYVFTLTITNASGIYTTPNLTFNYNGSEPEPLSFVDPAYPEQMALYSGGNSAGAVYCNRAGTTTPITFYFKLNPLDSPTLTSTVKASGIIPAGGAPSIVVNGAGSVNRSATLTPPSGGWQVGTYQFSVVIGDGTCSRSQSYYVHISDGNRPDVEVDNMTICYPGSGVVSATVPLPDVYKGVVNPSYFQEYSGRYELTVVSKPAGSGTPTFDPVSLRSFTNTSTVISNLNMQGEYIFKIKAIPPSGGDSGFIEKEYACSGTSYEDTFSVFVSTQVGANAGSDQNLDGATQTVLNGNNPGVATGEWTLLSKPNNAPDPTIVTPTAYNSNVIGLTSSGIYTFRWTVTTGDCISTSDVNITVKAKYCTTGCNGNSYIYSSDPNTIEYDNMVSTFHASLAKEKDGSFKVWGQASASNGTGDLLAPTLIAPANGFNYTGTALRVTGGSNSNTGHQFALLTTDGLYVWGTANTLISNTIKSNTAFGKISVNGKTDGLPIGVTPSDVKMMFGSYRTLAILTCYGDAWVLSFNGAKNGDGTTQNATNDVIWHRVKTTAVGNPNLDNVVALRGTSNALFALTSEGELYTWGTNTYLGDNTASTNRVYATPVSTSAANGIPVNTIPKMIGMTQAGSSANLQSYYLLATNGKLYAMGDNTNRQLGDGSTTVSNVWKEVTASSTVSGTTYNLGGNITWISPNEHSNYANSATINILTDNNKQWAWGANSGNMIGQSNANTYYDPIYMPGNSIATDGLSLTDEVVAVETGGHTTINIKKCSQNFGYVGHKTNGSMGDGTNAIGNPTTYSYSTSILVVCGTDTGPKVQEIKICQGTSTDLNNANLEDDPSEVEWHATNDVSSPVITDITAVGSGTYYAFYTAASGKCRLVGSVVTVSYYQSTDPENPCSEPYCYKPGATSGGTIFDTNVGITALGRAGATDADNWPMLRKGGWIALESKTKAFVPNRVAFDASGNPVGIVPANFVEGMMVYDTTNNCMKVYTLKEGATTMAWHCMTTQTCPE